jgi:hypothetical protein
MRRTLAVLAIALMPFAASAHDPRPGPNGGLKVDAGARYHAELVARGVPEVVLFLYDADDRPVPAKGFKANAILVVEGRTHRFALQPGEGSRMAGIAPVPVPAGVKGAVQLIAPDGATAQAKF